MEEDFNYTSMTVWQEKANFTVWREGDAFKEAHGGGTFKGVLDMLVSSARTLKGKPKAQMFEATATVSTPVRPEDLPSSPGGWREVNADGVNIIDSECFMVMQDDVPTSAAKDLAAAATEAKAGAPGFRFSTVLVPDAKNGKGDTGRASIVQVWDSRSAFEAAGAPSPSDAANFFEGVLVLTTHKGA